MNLLIGILILGSMSCFAKEYKIISLDCRGEIRYGGLTSNPVHLPLEILLIEKLAAKKVEINSYDSNVDAEVTCKYYFIQEIFNNFKNKAEIHVSVKLKTDDSQITQLISCPVTVNDGGNKTLKKSCAKKIAKTIRAILDLKSYKIRSNK